MKKLHAATIAVAIGLMALTPTDQALSATDVDVTRGGTVETVSANISSEAGVGVYRGAATPVTRAAEAPPAPPLVTMSGEIAWLFDTETGKLTGCEVIGSRVAGRNAIRCATRTLRRPPITVE